MQRMQRKVGAFLPRSADDHQVGMLIADFEAADKMLETLIDASNTWRKSWTDILAHQSSLLSDVTILYAEIPRTNPNDRSYAITPQETLERVDSLKTGYIELKDEMAEELGMIEKQIIAPAKDARQSAKQYMKVIKKREDKKLDWERYKSRMDKAEGKNSLKRTERETAALGKHQNDYAAATVAYEAADDHLKRTLPSITHATYSLLPHLLNAQIMIQNALLAQLYTTLHTYTVDFGFTANPPEADEIIRVFSADFDSIRKELEGSFKMLANGKAIREPIGGSGKGSTITGLNIRNGIGSRTTSASKTPRIGYSVAPAYNEDTTPSPPAASPGASSATSTITSRPKVQRNHSSYHRSASAPYTDGHGNGLLTPDSAAHHGYSPHAVTPNGIDYFAPPSHANHYHNHQRLDAQRRPSATSLASSTTSHSNLSTSNLSRTSTNTTSTNPSIIPSSSAAGAAAAIAAAKKKPPPPPPPKRIPSYNKEQCEYVTALYDFAGSQEGDLAFREGERIKVLRKKGREEWWEGEVGGERGTFPGNYVR